MLWIIQCVALAFWIKTGATRYNFLNTIQLTAADQSTVTITYNPTQLRRIKVTVDQHAHLKRLPLECIKTIKKLKINRRRIRLRKYYEDN